MPAEPNPTTLSDLVRRATTIVDAEGVDDAVTNFYARHEDDDAPVRGILDGLGDDPDEILKLAARSEFDGRPPEPVEAWLPGNGIDL